MYCYTVIQIKHNEDIFDMDRVLKRLFLIYTTMIDELITLIIMKRLSFYISFEHSSTSIF